VEVIEVDPLDSQPLQRLGQMPENLSLAQRRVAGRAAVRIADLGRDLCVLHEGCTLIVQPFAKHDLARSPAVGVGGIEAAKPDPPRMIEKPQRLLLAVARAQQPWRGADPAEIAAAEPDPLDVAFI